MATQYKTPGVYIQEPNSFPPSIVGVDTAVPVFIGYTEKATDTDSRNLGRTPKRIDSLAEFVRLFGGGYPERYYLLSGVPPKDGTGSVPGTDNSWGQVSLDGKNVYTLVEVGKYSFNLFNSLRLFYANGGGACYIVSCGTYGDPNNPPKIKKDDLKDGLAASASLIGPTIVVIPDLVLLDDPAASAEVAVEMLNSCKTAGDRMALLDVWGADATNPDKWDDAVDAFRDALRGAPPESWQFGAAYFPPLMTSVVSADEIDISNFATDATNLKTLKTALKQVLDQSFADPDAGKDGAPGGGGAPDPTGDASVGGGTTSAGALTAVKLNDKGKMIFDTYVNSIGASPSDATKANQAVTTKPLTNQQLTQALVAMVPGFQQLLTAIARTQSVMPPSGAMAGVWASNDALRGVWNAPANTGIATLIAPAVPISGNQQDDLNAPVRGLAINAIRTFQGRGSLVWGARTLDSNSNDWRYIQVRRTMIYVEQSVKQALEAMVFKPNTAQTWVTVVAMIESFLHGLWASGGLMGASPGEAYNVQAGLGSTMTPQDVLEGIMRVSITLQMVHPAEFIELTFKQQMLGGA